MEAGKDQTQTQQNRVLVDELPLTANGKIDRDALRDLECGRAEFNIAAETRTEIEKEVAAVWQSVLRVELISADDIFFDLGGHSLAAMLIASRLNHLLESHRLIRLLFDSPTIREFAGQIEETNIEEIAAMKRREAE